MSRKFFKYSDQFFNWRVRHVKDQHFVVILSIIVGISAGIAAVVIKNSVGFIHHLVHHYLQDPAINYPYFLLPMVGIALAVLFTKYVIRRPVRHGIPNVLYSISRRKGKMNGHNMFSSVITSALTVGFGGSVGLEGPTVSTGAAIGSRLSRFLRLDYKYIILMLACACAGSMAAIFKAPIAAIVFAVEVIMIDLTTFSLIPLLLASSSAVLTSYLFLGTDVLYPFQVIERFQVTEFPFYVGLGIFAGLVSTYFTKMYVFIEGRFERIGKRWVRLVIGGLCLGALVVIFPSLFGEGYESINSCLAGNTDYLFDQTIFANFDRSVLNICLLLALVMLFKVIATGATFGAGGVGGIFAPTLFTGVNTGMLFVLICRSFGFEGLNEQNFALIGMGGLIAGVLHAPLTGIFLIADISGGYMLFVPLMITATFSYLTTKIFASHSVYTIQLAKRKHLMTHHTDKQVLSIMKARDLIETDFISIQPEASLRELTQAISKSKRNLYPVVDKDGYLVGMLKLSDVREIMFDFSKFETVHVKDLMYMPEFFISPRDSMDEVTEKFEVSGRYNLAVIDDGKYLGFISRAKVFSSYRSHVKEFSHD